MKSTIEELMKQRRINNYAIVSSTETIANAVQKMKKSVTGIAVLIGKDCQNHITSVFVQGIKLLDCPLSMTKAPPS